MNGMHALSDIAFSFPREKIESLGVETWETSELETSVMSFFHVSDSFYLVLLFFYVFSFLLARFFYYLCKKYSIHSTYDEYQALDEDDEEEEEEVEKQKEQQALYTVEYTERDDLVADIILGGDALLFLPLKSTQKDELLPEEDMMESESSVYEDPDETFGPDEYPISDSTAANSRCNADVMDEEHLLTRDSDSIDGSSVECVSPMETDPKENGSVADDSTFEEGYIKSDEAEADTGNVETNFSEDEKFLTFAPTQLETKKLQPKAEDTYGDSFTVGSSSKSSSEWRSSMLCRDSGTEDPFSSSSRRSCPNWESYTVFRKYDEEMMFLDRISAQKLNETESLKGIEVCPRSISQRIVHKLNPKNRRSIGVTRNPYHELESAYVAQVCLAWEALNWNYKSFQRLRASRTTQEDPGCPGRIAQQFQQFQVLLQRFIENEPYEYGRRPEVYARLRISAPKLLQVPEFRETEEEQKEEGFGSKISSPRFLRIMEDGIQTFMNFLKADKERPCKIITEFFRRKKSNLVDTNHLYMVKKANRKKKMKLNDLRRSNKCLRKKKKLKHDEEMEILMGLIDLKVVSRVLRMSEISEEQLSWCEVKMSKVRLWEGKLQRDSSPLFFPAH